MDKHPEQLLINKQRGSYVGLSSVRDYTYRPRIYDNVSLYDWICLSKKEFITKSDHEAFNDDEEEEEELSNGQLLDDEIGDTNSCVQETVVGTTDIADAQCQMT